MDFIKFLDEISLQPEVKEKVLKLINDNYDTYLNYVDLLNDVKKSEDTYNELSEKYSEDIYNFNILSIYLLSAFKILDKYNEVGIDKSIFIDTMKCFSRFIDECYVKTGKYYFDRGFWTYRQTNMSLYRIGTLEYEFTTDNKVSIHIPSDSLLTEEEIESSIRKFYQFLDEFYPEKKDCEVFCNSWILSPELSKYLNPNSKILLFQTYFKIVSFDPNPTDIFEWVFKCNNNCDINSLKEETSLQRNLKKALLAGKKIGTAYGKLKKK